MQTQPVDTAAVPAPPQRKYLLGVQGLRTVAALLVAVYHIWFHRVSGGVDVFFVVAGYFAAGSLLRSFSAGTGASDTLRRLAAYLLGTLRRIVPSATIVVVGTVLLSRYFMPLRGQSESIEPAVAALGFWENWQLISASADYAQQDSGASPFQQFWALAVNAQFYLLFSVLVCLLVLAVRPWRRRAGVLRAGMLVLGGTIFVASFVFSIYETSANQTAAYFNTFARLWEFMAGVFVFLLLKRESTSKRWAAVLGWSGIVLLFTLGAFFDLSRLLPGYLSLLPVLAACGILVSAFNDVEPRPLTWAPMLAIADASFAFYLWHWPLLVVYRYRFGDDVSLIGGIGIISLALVLAVLTTRLVEDPIRKSPFLGRRWWATLVVAAGLLTVPLALVNYWESRIEIRLGYAIHDIRNASRILAERAEEFPDGPPSAGLLIPHPSFADRDDSQIVYGGSAGCRLPGIDAYHCEWGDPEAEHTVVVVGGSHAIQWIEPVVEASEQFGARTILYGMGGCAFVDPVVDADDWPWVDDCVDWNDSTIAEILAEEPALVVTMGTTSQGRNERVTPGMISRFQALSDAGISVLGLRDNPRFGFRVPECVERDGAAACAIDRSEVFEPLESLLPPPIEGVEFMDLADLYCGETMCEVTDGFILQYQDNNHLSNTWVRERGWPVRDKITEILDLGEAES
ncbi:Peptidoglycan/LPS O-acetylase OafA/YrhL, contains acyltransferase and SGNH-hydrolase domains [Ruaniaceae bacterium KH17]|nr:Peptidoglycan/LPS O-acetylase OafA/YrhL, contains acyltransferase and SGNH-hydrolase domains [Ruaniaceae bacterium KH17]